MSETRPAAILVCTDLSASPDEAIRTAAGLAGLSGAELHVLHAFDLDNPPYAAPETGRRPGFPDRLAAAQRALAEQVDRSVTDSANVASKEVVIRTPHLAILERAREVGADLIVLGPHQRRRVGEGLLGSTADRVLRGSEVPCLIVRHDLPLPLRRVMVPIDLSPTGRAALQVGLMWAMAYGRESAADGGTSLDVVHVAPSEFNAEGIAFGDDVILPELRKEIAGAVDRMGTGAVSTDARVLWSDRPADALLEYAGASGADLIVLGTHGQGAIRRALIGSVASGVARRAETTVLLVPPVPGKGTNG